MLMLDWSRKQNNDIEWEMLITKTMERKGEAGSCLTRI
jgi:hypothetical protein